MSKGHRIQLKLSNGYRLDDLNKTKWSWVITQSVKYLWVLTDTHEWMERQICSAEEFQIFYADASYMWATYSDFLPEDSREREKIE